MTRFEHADLRIAECERELARVQYEETWPTQIEAAFAREKLKSTLSTASVFANATLEILDQLGDSFEESVARMAQELNGKE